MKRLILISLLVLLIAGVFLFFKRESVLKMTPSVTSSQTPNDDTAIKQILTKEVPQRGGVKKFEVVQLKIRGAYAAATLKPLDIQTDNATVYLKKENDKYDSLIIDLKDVKDCSKKKIHKKNSAARCSRNNKNRTHRGRKKNTRNKTSSPGGTR